VSQYRLGDSRLRIRKFRTSPEDDSDWDTIFQHFGVTGEGDTELFRGLQKKLILDINSTPVSDNESEPERVINLKNSTTLEAYTQYKEDVNKALASQPDLRPQQEQPKAPSVFEHFQDNPCPYRAIVKAKDNSFSVYCETKKIPAEVCITQQKRYLAVDRTCRPLSKKSRRPRQPAAPRQGSTKFSMGDNEDAGDLFSLGDQ
jgi:hypothetical protein